MASYELTVRPRAVLGSDGAVRHLVVNAATHRLLVAPSLYAAHLNSGGLSPNTARNRLVALAHLYSWAAEVGIDVDARLLRGEGLLPREARAFTHALKKYQSRSGKPLESDTVADVLLTCRIAFAHFISQYRSALSHDVNGHKVSLAALLEADGGLWKSITPNRTGPQEREAPDLTDEQIAEIEHYLNPPVRIAAGERPEVAHRNYLLWRLCIALGLRLGEALALRLQDCDGGLVRIVRVQDRGGTPDPRGTRAPRPKTLGRELGVLSQDPVLPQLISRYGATHRYYRRRAVRHTVNEWDMEHDYLLLDHTCGQPLSVDGAEYVARKIRKAVGFDFHWHLARHAFFNRMYDVIADQENFQALLVDMQYWGGWRHPRSLLMYTKRAVADRASRKLNKHQEKFKS